MHRENRGGWLQLGYFAYIWGERWVMGWWRTAVQIQPWSGCQTHLYPELFPVVIFTEFLFQSKCHSLPLCRPVVPALPTAACPAGGAFQTDSWDQVCSQQWGPCWCSSVVQVPGSAFQELSSLMGEPGLQRADGHHMHLYFLRCWHSAPSTQSSITLTLLPDVVWCLSVVKNLLCPQQSLPLKLLTDFLVSDWRQNRRN